jgi:DNA-binding NarL/FixJ family response regulator
VPVAREGLGYIQNEFMLNLLLVEDNEKLRPALKSGLQATGAVRVVHDCDNGPAALAYCLASSRASDEARGLPDVILMDVQLAGPMNGIQAAVAIRRELPRMPVVFYSIQDDDSFYRDFFESGILTHYAYVRKSNYLLPTMLVPLMKDAIAGRSFVDPDIAERVQQVRRKDENHPLALLEPNEREVVRLLARGMTNEQIARQLGLRDARAVSRANGQIYAAWHLADNTTDEKVARTRAVMIHHAGQMIEWDEDGVARVQNAQNQWVPFQ